MESTQIKADTDSVTVTVNPKVYPIETVYSAAYVFLDSLYILLDGDPETGISVKLTPKNKTGNDTMEKIGMEFANELINYADYRERAKDSRKIREMLLQRALFTNDPASFTSKEADFDEEEFNTLMKELEKEEIEDPDDIAVPWEEKYGKKDSA